jgi:hypothetical protein
LTNDPQIKPFDTIVDLLGNLWVTGNRSDSMYVFSPSGALIATLPRTYNGKTVLTKPIGRSLGQPVRHQQLEDRRRPVPEPGRQRGRHRGRNCRADQDARDRTARAV